MPTQSSEARGLGSAVKEVSERASAIVRLELELAALELKRKVAALGIGIGLAIGALVFGLFALGFLFAGIAAALAEVMPTWAALLVVFAALLVTAALLLVLGLKSLKRGTPPVPEQAIEEAKLTTAALRRNGS